MNARDRLYGLTAEPLAAMNQRAHRGGGTETIEVPSGEGLIEDQYEAHLKNLYVAYREPTAAKIAGLAVALEKAGFTDVAEKVDAVLAGFYQPEMVKRAEEQGGSEIQQMKRVIVHNARVARDILDKAGFREWGIIHNLKDKSKIVGWVDQLIEVVSAQDTNWDTVASILANLLNDDLLHGSSVQIGEVDLENVLGPQFRNYKQALDNVDAEVQRAQALTAGDVASKEQLDTGERQKVAPSASDPKEYIANAQALNQQISNLQQAAELAISKQTDPQKTQQIEAQIQKMFQQAAPLFAFYRKKVLPNLVQIQTLTPQVRQSFDPALKQVNDRVSTMRAQLESL